MNLYAYAPCLGLCMALLEFSTDLESKHLHPIYGSNQLNEHYRLICHMPTFRLILIKICYYNQKLQ